MYAGHNERRDFLLRDAMQVIIRQRIIDIYAGIVALSLERGL